MKKFTPLLILAVLIAGALMQPTFGQSAGRSLQQDKYRFLNYIFPSDSLQGFDATQANLNALNGGFFGLEYKVYMYRAKRNYINLKYNINQTNGWNSYARTGPVSTLAAPCVNEDFESSPVGLVGPTLLGWTISEGSNTASCTMGGCCPTSGGLDAWVRTTPYAGPAPMTSIPNSPLGGTKVLQMNDNITNMGEVVRIQQTFNVTPTNALFQLAYMAAMDGSAHLCCDQPYMKITMLDCSNNPLACPSISITPPGSACTVSSPSGWTVNTSGISYTASWQVSSIDLTPYLGTCVTIQITVGDCDGWAHPGWAFVDCLCSPMTVMVNNVPFPIGTTAATVAACGAATGTVSAPPGLGPYTWNGPPGSGITNNTNQTFTSSTSGNYTLTMNPFGSCTPITRTVSLTFAPNPSASFTSANACTTYSFTNTGAGPPAVQTYSFVGAGPPPSFTTTATTTVVSFPPSTTFTVLHTVTNSSGCTSTNSIVINTPAGPSAAFTASPSYTQCLLGNSFTFTSLLPTTTTHTYAFNPTTGGPPSGFTNPYGPVSFTAAGTYTVTHTVTQAGCTTSASSVIVINPQPTVTATNNGPLCTGATLSLTGTGGGTYSWSGPAGFSSTLQNPTVAGVTAANAGTYSLTVTLNGCTTTTTTVVSIGTATASASNTGPYCAGATIQLNTPAATTYSWSGPSAFSSTIQNPTRPGATLAMAGIYTVTVTSGVCVATATTNVVVNAAPTPSASSNSPVCAGTPINFTGSGASTYTWTGPASYSSTVQNPVIASASAANAGTYTLTATAVGGCTASITTSVVVNPLPVPVAANNGPLCVGSTLSLSTTPTGATYSWTGPNSFSSTLQNPTLAGVTLAAGGTYTVLVTLNTCTALATTNVVISTATASASNTGPYCAGATIQLNTPAATSYTWTGPGGYTSNVQNPTRPASTPAMSGTYTVVISIGTCTATATTSVTVNALPTPTAANTGPYCPGNTIQLSGSSATTYTWSGPSAFSSNLQNPTQGPATTAMSGVYTFSVTDANGCKSSTTTAVTVNPNPTPVIGSNSPVCVGNNINLTSGGGTSYAWSGPAGFTSAVQNPTVVGAALSNSGVYTVTVTSLGCTATNTVNVTVTTATASASNTGPYCAGATIQLNTPAATSYTWSGPGFSSNAQSPTRPASTVAMSGNYTVVISIGTCTASATTSVTVNALPTPTALNSSPVCAGGTISFTGLGGATYYWGGPSSYTSALQNPSISNATSANAGTYTLLVFSANSCSNIAVTNVVVNPTPTISVNNPTVCVNQSINLTSNGGAGYAWSGPNAYSSAIQNPVITNAATNMSGPYTVTVTSAAGCTNTAVANVNVFPLPTPAIISNTPCVGNTLNLNGSGGAVYTWSGPNSFSSVSQSPSITNVTALAGGTYTLIAAAGSCTASTTANITINPLPTPVINSNSPVCIGQPVNFTGSGGTSYVWVGPMGFSDFTQNPSIPVAATGNSGTYTLTVTDANGCVKSTTGNVSVNPQPVVSASGGTVCENSNANLYATGGATYSWTGPNGFTSGIQNPAIAGATQMTAGQYTVVVTDVNTCTNTAYAVIGINPAPTPSITTNSPICINNVLSLAATGGTAYAWTGPNGFVSSAQSATIQANSLTVSGNYSVTVVSNQGCTAATGVSVTINPLPTGVIVSTPNKGCAPLCVTYTCNTIPANATSNWMLGDGSSANNTFVASACYNKTGTYTITASFMDLNGCQGATTYTAQVYPIPVADFNYSPYHPIETVDDVTFTDASYGATITGWSWYFMNTAEYTSTLQNPVFNYQSAGEYAVALVVKSDIGCMDTIVKSIVVGEDFGIWVPDAFTPNDDGLNDVFYAKGFGVSKFEMFIFDRWGEKIFHSVDINSAWDGTFQGRGDKKCTEDVYTWQVKVTSVYGKAKEMTGHVTLIK